MEKKNIKIITATILLAFAVIFTADYGLKHFQAAKAHKTVDAADISLVGPRGNVPENTPRGGGFGVFSIPVPGVLSRSGQPTADEFRWLKENGWKSIINFRVDREKDSYVSDLDIANLNEIGLAYLNIPIKDGGTPSEEQAVQFLKFITDPKNQPANIHCAAGTGRTGLMAALYRYAVQGWPMDKAIAEKSSFGSDNETQKKWLEKWASNHSPGEYAAN